ncbi:hypothetical protein GE09DRAFT_1163936 [Coniochaeta sp. 2T2.1]|nr:hypothetical protein GE09DRAFT_1163936 [Coniochaeta sp. 2T2.1]
MHLTLHNYVLPVLGCMSMLGMALPTEHFNLVPRAGTSPVYINRDLEFTSAPQGSATTRLSRRKVLVPFTSDNLNDDFCSETSPNFSYGSDAALAADCVAVQNEIATRDGYFTISPSNFDAATGWARIATSGTCSFGVKFQLAKDTKRVIFGTNDVLFYIKNYVGNAQNGKIRAQGTISCSNDIGGENSGLLLLFWGMIHS